MDLKTALQIASNSAHPEYDATKEFLETAPIEEVTKQETIDLALEHLNEREIIEIINQRLLELKQKMASDNGYVLIPWPDVQEYMEEPWFSDEAVLSEEGGYFIPNNRIVS